MSSFRSIIHQTKILRNSQTHLLRYSSLIVLAIIAVIGASVRLYQLDTLVSILNRDEAALAYNALMLEKLGVDEWGEPLSLNLKSFGDYKLIGYPALLMVFFKTLPVEDFTVRLPSVLAGIGIIILSYPLARVFKLSKLGSWLFSFIIALSPFAIFYSRFAYEANVALLYMLLALWLLLNWVGTNDPVLFQSSKRKIGRYLSKRKRVLLDLVAVGFLVLACFTYNSPLVVFMPIVLIVVISRIKDGWVNWLPLLIMGVIAWLGVIWATYPVISQKSGISLMTDPLVGSQYPSYRQKIPSLLKPLLGNQYVYWVQLANKNALESISGEFLLTKIFHPWHGVPGRGQLLWPVVVMGWVGLIWLVGSLVLDLMKITKHQIGHLRSKIKPTDNTSLAQFIADPKFMLLSLLFVSLMPAIITVDAPHATRSLLFLFLFCLISVWGLQEVIMLINRNVKVARTRRLIYYSLPLIMIILVILSAFEYAHDLFGQYGIEAKGVFQAGIIDAIQQLPRDGQVAVLDPDGYEYIRWAWYNQLDPKEFLTSIQRRPPSVAGLRYGVQVGRFRFIDQVKTRQPQDISLVQWSEASSSWEVLP